jgi:hypothetical protein
MRRLLLVSFVGGVPVLEVAAEFDSDRSQAIVNAS